MTYVSTKLFTVSTDTVLFSRYEEDLFILSVTVIPALFSIEVRVYAAVVEIQKKIMKFLEEKHYYYSRNRKNKRKFRVRVIVKYPIHSDSAVWELFRRELREKLEFLTFPISMVGSLKYGSPKHASSKVEGSLVVRFAGPSHDGEFIGTVYMLPFFPILVGEEQEEDRKNDPLRAEGSQEPLFDWSDVAKTPRILLVLTRNTMKKITFSNGVMNFSEARRLPKIPFPIRGKKYRVRPCSLH